MGFFRTLYREARDILGLKPPPENATQRAERVCGEVRTDLGGKREKRDDDYILNTRFKDRDVTVLFDAEAGRARIAVAAPSTAGVTWAVARDSLTGDDAPGPHRATVGTKLYIEGISARDLAEREARWKTLPTGARGVIAQLLQKSGGVLELDGDGVLTFTPEAETLADKSAKYTIKGQVTILVQVVEGIEDGWS